MPRPRKGYSTEVASLGALLKRVDVDTKPAKVWRDKVKEQVESLIRLLLAADHDPSDYPAERK